MNCQVALCRGCIFKHFASAKDELAAELVHERERANAIAAKDILWHEELGAARTTIERLTAENKRLTARAVGLRDALWRQVHYRNDEPCEYEEAHAAIERFGAIGPTPGDRNGDQ